MNERYLITAPGGRLVIENARQLAILREALETLQGLARFVDRPTIVVRIDSITVETAPDPVGR